MKKFIKNSITFLLFLVLILGIKKVITPYYMGNNLFNSKLNYYNFNYNNEKYNTVFFGSSRIYRHINPILLDSLLYLQNLKSFNFATPGAFNPESYFLYENFIDNLTNNDIKYAFLELQELNYISEKNLQTTKANYWNDLHFLNYSYNYILASKNSKSLKCKYIFNYTVSYIYSFLDFKILENKFKLKDIKHIGLNGFYPLDKELIDSKNNEGLSNRYITFNSDTTVLNKRILEAQNSKKILNNNDINQYHLEYLISLINKSNKKDIKLIFILPPRLSKNDYLQLIPLANSLPQKNIIKLNDPEKYKVLYMAEYSFDIGHLNSKGANFFTKYLADELAQIVFQVDKNSQN
jgi:hypothetical protein